MLKIGWLLCAGAIAIVASISSAYACGPGVVQLEDSFDELDPSWGDGGDTLQIVDGQLHIVTTTPQTFRAISHFSIYEDVDICVSTTHVKGPPDQSSAGIIYWFADAENFYWFATSPAGTYAAFRLVKNRWSTLIPWTASDAVKKGTGAVNLLRVQTKGNVSTLFINDKQVSKLKGVPPKNGQLVGVGVEQFSADAATEAFDDFTTAEP